MAEVRFERVSKVYPDGTRAVSEMQLEIADQEFMVLVGPSGCGKTTALRMVAGLEEISDGQLTIGERVVNDLPSRDRDIAMVFQSYALYPHLSVYENIAFGLRLKKVPKDEIDRRVRDAARVLDLTEWLGRKPRNLSGGQRQRVAMGRAIVRHPQAFLMDEPLSNLDAKLRVQMRAEIARLQDDLGVTTIYVTHDQVEAMTMGDRVAVMRRGELQQVATPQELYDRPVNVFVGGFIGSPAMNLVEARLERSGDDYAVELGDQRLTLAPELVAARPALAQWAGRELVLGIRPESLEDAAVAGDPPDGLRLRGAGDAARGARVGGRRPRDGHGARRAHRRGARAGARQGDRGTRRRHRRGDGRRAALPEIARRRGRADRAGRRHRRPSLLRSGNRAGHLRRRGQDGGNDRMRRHRIATAAALLALAPALLAAGCGSDDDDGGSTSTSAGGGTSTTAAARDVSGSVSVIGIWTGDEQRSFQAVIDRFNETYPDVKVRSRRPATTCRRSSARPSRAATRPTSRRSRSPG